MTADSTQSCLSRIRVSTGSRAKGMESQGEVSSYSAVDFLLCTTAVVLLGVNIEKEENGSPGSPFSAPSSAHLFPSKVPRTVCTATRCHCGPAANRGSTVWGSSIPAGILKGRSDRTSTRSISFCGYLVGSWLQLQLHLPLSCLFSTKEWARWCLYLWGPLECSCGMAKEGGSGIEPSQNWQL